MIVLEGNLEDSKSTLIRTAAALDTASQSGGLFLDLTRCQYMGPYAATMLAGAIKRAESLGQPWQIRLPQHPPQLMGFLQYCGLAKMLEKGMDPDPGNPQSETVPISPTRVTYLAAKPIHDLVFRHMGETHADFEENLGLCVREVFQNIEDHARSAYGGLFCARCLKMRKEVRIAIVDGGAGIHATLLPNYPQLKNPVLALQSVIQGDFTARSTRRNLGLGISNLARVVENVGGRVVILSANGCADYNPKSRRWNFEELSSSIAGTGFFFSFPIQPMEAE